MELASNQRWVAWKYYAKGGQHLCKLKFHEYGKMTYVRSSGGFHEFDAENGKRIICLIEFKT